MSGRQKIVAIIPAWNEEDTIRGVVSGLYSLNIDKVIVVNNGSSDNTKQHAYEEGAEVLTENRRGYGRACLTGIEHIPEGFDWILFCDADGSDDLSDLEKFWPHLDENDLIIGNRRATKAGRKNLTPVQNFGNWLSGFLMKIGWGRGFHDLGPLRIIRKEALDALQMEDENFGWTVEMQAKALETNLRCQEIPVNYLDRQGGVSKISGSFTASFKAGTIILSTLGKLFLERKIIQTVILAFSILLLISGALALSLKGNPATVSGAAPFFVGASVMIAGYLFSHLRKGWTPTILLGIALLLRLILIPMAPGDDVWRYLWEGMIQNHGFNPYNLSPDSDTLSHLQTDWWSKINNKEATAIYPPLTQLIFRIACAFSSSVLLFKLIFILADLAICVLLLKAFGSASKLYLLNPLVIYCVAGGAHYEALFLLPLVAAWILWRKNDPAYFFTGLLLGASISFKLVAVLAAAFVGWQILTKERSIKKLCLFSLGIFLIPLLSYITFSALAGIPNQLYPAQFTAIARSASFIPWLSEEYLNHHPYDFIPNKVFAYPLGIILILITLFSKSFAGFQSRSFLALLAFSPMVHAWYFIWLLPFAIKRHTVVITLLTFTGFLYFMLPYRQALNGEWVLSTWERFALWAPYLILIVSFFKWLKALKVRP